MHHRPSPLTVKPTVVQAEVEAKAVALSCGPAGRPGVLDEPLL